MYIIATDAFGDPFALEVTAHAAFRDGVLSLSTISIESRVISTLSKGTHIVPISLVSGYKSNRIN